MEYDDAYSASPDDGAWRVAHPDVRDDERTYALLIHLSLLAYLVFPLLVVIPLVMWLVRREQSAFIDDHGKEAVNFHLSLVLYTATAIGITIVTCGIGFFLIPIVAIGSYVLGVIGMVMAAMAANRGEFYRYPMCMRLIV